MAFWCNSGVGERHQHETIAEMKEAHEDSYEGPYEGPRAGDVIGFHKPDGTIGTRTFTEEEGEVPYIVTALPKSPPAAPAVDPVPTPIPEPVAVPSPVPVAPTTTLESVVDGFLDRTPPLVTEPVKSWSETRREQIETAGAKDMNGRPFYDKRLALVKGMIEMIPDGYYATQADDTATVDFLRINRPDRGKWKDHIKIQTQHSELWRVDMALLPDGIWLVQDARVIDSLMLTIADHRTCSTRYAIELQKCRVCNTTLTDDRSRHYLIGPICDQKDSWLWVIEEVDDKNLGLSYEQLVARGLPTRVWQDRELRRA